jgi:glycerophosphoryl diester phosphodiesterase
MRMRLLIVLFGALFTLPAAEASAQGNNPWLQRRVLNIAHRGGRAEAPEHTLYAYTVALPKGVNTLEVDVRRTVDGVLVVHHDSTVNRVTDGTGAIDTMTLAQVKALDNAYWFAPVCSGNCQGQPPDAYPFRGVATGATPPPAGFAASDFQIATVREVLETFPGVLMSIEIKGQAPDSVPAAEETADLLREFGRITDVLVASFDDATLAAFKARDAEIHTTPGEDFILDFVFNPGPVADHVAFQIPRTFQGAPVVDLVVPPAHANGLAVYVFIDPGEETPAIYNELIDSGVDGIITDRPTDLQQVLEDRGVVFQESVPGLSGWTSAMLAILLVAAAAVARRRGVSAGSWS